MGCCWKKRLIVTPDTTDAIRCIVKIAREAIHCQYKINLAIFFPRSVETLRWDVMKVLRHGRTRLHSPPGNLPGLGTYIERSNEHMLVSKQVTIYMVEDTTLRDFFRYGYYLDCIVTFPSLAECKPYMEDFKVLLETSTYCFNLNKQSRRVITEGGE